MVKGKKHLCGFGQCSVCKEVVNINEHKCYIQPVALEQEPAVEEEDLEEGLIEEEPEEGERKQPPPPPLYVYADFEAMTNEDGEFIPDLLCYATSDNDDVQVLEGEECTLEFLNVLDDLTEESDNDEDRPINIIFHNLKGFDGIFLIKELYEQQREVTEQLSVGAKILSFKSGPLHFIDSLSFLPFPLANFASTFYLTELKKGFFPHLFHTKDQVDYVGPIPALEFFYPNGMKPKKKLELER